MTTIKLKNGSGAPLAGDLVQGEPALDLTNKRLYTEDSGGTVIEVGTNPTSVTTGVITSTGIDVTGSVTATSVNTGAGIAGRNAFSSGDIRVAAPNDTNISLMTVSNTLATIKTDFYGGGSLVPLVIQTGTNNNQLYLDTIGNVGIGTSSPSTKLHLGGTAPGDSIIRQDSTASGTNWEIGEREAGKWQIFEDDGDSIVATFTSSGNVGIGNSSPLGRLTISNAAGTNAPTTVTAANTYLQLGSDDYGPSNNGKFMIGFGFTDATNTNSPAYIGYEEVSTSGDTYGDLTFYTRSVTTDTAPTERMRIDASGNVLVGKTSGPNYNTVGIDLTSFGELQVTGDSRNVATFNRQTSNGDIAVFRKDGTAVGSIGSTDGLYPYIGGSAGGFGDVFLVFISNSSLSIRPATASGSSNDNAIDLGATGARFDDIYATNGTIQTSDRNEKQDIEALSDAEQRVAVACKGLLRKFRWIDSVEEKGDDARIHFGIMAQDLEAAFAAEGLDAGRYAMFISATWWESTEVIPAVEAKEAVVDEEGNVVEEAVEAQEERTVVHTHDTAEEAPEGSVERTRLGVRYPQLLAFIIAAI